VTVANWAPARVRQNFRIDLFSAICGGVYVAVLVAFMPVVVRRMGGSATEVALVVASPFIGHLCSPIFAYAFAHLPLVRVVAGTVTLSRTVFLVGVLVATTPLMLAVTTVASWIISIANVAAYTALMQGMYPDSERAQAMASVRIGAAISGIVAAAVAGTLIDAVPAQWVFAAAALVALPGALNFFRVQSDGTSTPHGRRPAREIARDVWADQRYRHLLIAFTVFGWGNLMNVAIYPLMLVDHFDASNSFVGILAAVQLATMIVAYLFVGRMIDRGSSLRQTFLATLLVLLVPIGYLVAPASWALLPVAAVAGITIASSELTYHTNIVQVAPAGRTAEYAAAQSFLLGVRGTAAPFAASALLGFVDTRAVLAVGLLFMVAGTAIMARTLRGEARREVALEVAS